MRQGAKQPLILPLIDITLNAAAFWNNALIYAETVSTSAIRNNYAKGLRSFLYIALHIR